MSEFDLPSAWRKSSHSGASGDNCVEISGSPTAIAVRDSKDPEGPKLVFGRAAFSVFARGLRVR
ncbi:DUF397 domain-containing protein [Actinocorallia aurantiaca]|uniref:DUF397 domain-containing protein n=1 Tax=Actinocorallia aurantiaca TaxID=46204 RepID=A0ABN3U4Y7_9ACTN